MAAYSNWPEEEIYYGSEYPELLSEPPLRDGQMIIPADSEVWHDGHWRYSFLQTWECLSGTFESLLPLMGRSIAFSMAQRIVWMCGFNERICSVLIGALGLLLLWSNSSAIFHLYAFILYFCISTATLFLVKRSPHKGHYVALVTFIYTVLTQFYSTDVEFMAFRGSMMIASMKQISLAYDARGISATDLPALVEYIFNPSTLLFGPFNTSEQYYLAKKRSQTMDVNNFVKDVMTSFKYLAISLIFVAYSSCISDQIPFLFNEPWLEYYTTAQAFRFSHCFVCYLSLFTALIGGFAESDVRATDWTAIEWPRSLTEVVVFWNLPMHSFLHKYIFRKACHNFGYFAAMVSTFLASALLHGFNFQLTAVLLSLGFYAYVESTFRKQLASILSACIESRSCGPKCTHRHKKWNFWVLAINVAFVFLNIFHLAYLGAPFQQIEAQQHGYSWQHTLSVWAKDWRFSSHIISVIILIFSFILSLK
ncbi:MBOAT, membrane-bound o-acyltransferase family domain-containing protein [Ditylenchus destructor]|uniref:Protein-serine O-palmitoleoyltransferase porcupine n=1 Tax=Ditylenchus destructor TaxID=166010 RepID=A0AAD4MTS6_9BILA|nr:MBOAT, membrane-bound o-acyltransferase family domain-containing protein [Ditylenchus destructor]